MKTLDQVITALELCCTDDNPCDKCPYTEFDKNGVWACSMCGDFAEDALHYLKNYQSDMQMYAANQKHWEDELAQKIKDFGDAKDRYIARLKELDIGTLNEPLTWEQLKTMEGKPVWIKYGNNQQSRWVIIYGFHGRKSELQYMDVSGIYPDTFWQKDMGADEYWQAYRKERHETGD